MAKKDGPKNWGLLYWVVGFVKSQRIGWGGYIELMSQKCISGVGGGKGEEEEGWS